MTSITNAAASLTLSLLMTLSQWFSEGVTQYKAEKYEAAAKAFSRVIDSKSADNPLLETSLYLRAQCYGKLKKPGLAEKDLTRLLEAGMSEDFEKVAIADFKALTGKEWSGVNLSTPENTWKSIVHAANKRDIKMLGKCFTGEMHDEVIKELAQDPDGWDEFAQILVNTTFRVDFYNTTSNKACVTLTMNMMGDVDDEQMLMVKNEKKWLLADEYNGEAKREFEKDGIAGAAPGAPGRARWTEDTNRLRQLDAAVEQAALANARHPDELADAADYVRNFDQTSTSSVNGKPFTYNKPTQPGGQHWIYMSSPVDGKRQGLINGSIQTVPETEFKRLARAAGIKMPLDLKNIKVSKTETREIEVLIQQLGARGFRPRREAYDKLKAMGKKAAPLLQKAQNNPDPEIALQCRKLLDEL